MNTWTTSKVVQDFVRTPNGSLFGQREQAYSEIEFPKQVIDAHAIGAVVTQIGNGVRA